MYMSFNWENEYRKNILMVLRNIKTEKPDRTVASLRKECMKLVETAQFPYIAPNVPKMIFL